jgi:hypothetical protein
VIDLIAHEKKPMRGWLVLYSFGNGDILPRHYRTEKNANKFAEEHRACSTRCEAVVLNVEDVIAWINSSVDELERIFKL